MRIDMHKVVEFSHYKNHLLQTYVQDILNALFLSS